MKNNSNAKGFNKILPETIEIFLQNVSISFP